MRHHQAQAGVLGHHLQALGGEARVHRHVGGTCLEHPDQGWQQVRAAWQADAHALSRACATGLQNAGDLIRLGFEGAVGQVAFSGDDGRGVGRQLGLARHPGFDASLRIQGAIRSVPIQ